MKDYNKFLLELINSPIPKISGSTDKDSGSTEKTEKFAFDEVSYQNISKELKNFWNQVFTERMLNFERDNEDQLKAKMKDPKYEKYWGEINKYYDKIIQKNKEKQIALEQQNLKSLIIGAFKQLGYYPKVVNNNMIDEYIKKFPNLSSGDLVKKLLNEKGIHKVKPTKQVTSEPTKKLKPNQ